MTRPSAVEIIKSHEAEPAPVSLTATTTPEPEAVSAITMSVRCTIAGKDAAVEVPVAPPNPGVIYRTADKSHPRPKPTPELMKTSPFRIEAAPRVDLLAPLSPG